MPLLLAVTQFFKAHPILLVIPLLGILLAIIKKLPSGRLENFFKTYKAFLGVTLVIILLAAIGLEVLLAYREDKDTTIRQEQKVQEKIPAPQTISPPATQEEDTATDKDSDKKSGGEVKYDTKIEKVDNLVMGDQYNYGETNKKKEKKKSN